MSEWPWRSPEATRQALSAHIAKRFSPDERQRRLREVAYRRLLARLFATQPDRWVVKGGASLLLRLDPNRTSNDIDLAYVVEAGEHAIALDALREATSVDLGDFFSFAVGGGEFVDADHPLERALSVPVVARIGEQKFAEFSVDLALPTTAVEIEWVENPGALTGVDEVDRLPPVATLRFPAQLADKTCAVHEKHGADDSHSSRARDLADIAMIAGQVDIVGAELERELQREEGRRLAVGTLKQPLPPSLTLTDAQASDWSRRWARATRGAPIAYEDALKLSRLLVDPALSRTVADKVWRSALREWEPASIAAR